MQESYKRKSKPLNIQICHEALIRQGCFFLSGKCFLFLQIFILSFLPFFSHCAFADDIQKTEDIYIIAETNGIAAAICKAIEIGQILMVPLFAIMFSILGLRAFQGDLKWTSLVTFALGIAAFKAAGSIAEWFMPNMGLQYGCKCAIERDIKDIDGKIQTLPTGLNYDCTEGFSDYIDLHGPIINVNQSENQNEDEQTQQTSEG